MSHNSALMIAMHDHLVAFGGISAGRVRLSPSPGTASLDDLRKVNEAKDGVLYELVEGTLVAKAMSFEA